LEYVVSECLLKST